MTEARPTDDKKTMRDAEKAYGDTVRGLSGSVPDHEARLIMASISLNSLTNDRVLDRVLAMGDDEYSELVKRVHVRLQAGSKIFKAIEDSI
jgi:hypothetical protein